jgi:hypothetical protein
MTVGNARSRVNDFVLVSDPDGIIVSLDLKLELTRHSV